MQTVVSIIIPCYNVAPHLSKCVESIIAQTYKNFELILINDGSIDDTGKIADEFALKDSRVKVFHQKNGGASSARNFAIERATSDIVLFIDGDDYIKPEYIAQLLENYEEGNWPICGMVNIKNQTEANNQNFQRLLDLYPERKIQKKNFMDLLAYNSFSSPCVRIYDLKIIQKYNIRFDTNVSYQEDLLFNLKYAKHINYVKLVDYFGYCYVEHAFSSTGRFHENFKQRESLLAELVVYIHSSNDRHVLQEFIFQTAMREISNIMHKNSPKTKKAKIADLDELLKSESYTFFKAHIKKTNINFILKNVLMLGNASVIYQYYNLSK
jgi:glycosyltransferase involved in cell wall biosynthesis